MARWSSLPDDILDNILNRLDLSPNTSITISPTTFDVKLEDFRHERDLVWNILDNLFTIFVYSPLLNTFRLQLPHDLYLSSSYWHMIGSWIRQLREHNLQHFKVTSKNLKQLTIYLYGSSILEVIIETPKLEHLYFYSDCLSYDEIMLDSITHVKSLALLQLSPRLYNYPSPNKIIFPNMTRLILALGPFRRIEDLSSMLHCPNLEELELEVTDFFWMVITRKPKVAPFEHVKRLKFQMDAIRLDQALLDLVEYLLRSMPALEKLIMYARSSKRYYLTKSLPEDEFYRSLNECPRSSPVCEIEFLGAYGSPICSRD